MSNQKNYLIIYNYYSNRFFIILYYSTTKYPIEHSYHYLNNKLFKNSFLGVFVVSKTLLEVFNNKGEWYVNIIFYKVARKLMNHQGVQDVRRRHEYEKVDSIIIQRFESSNKIWVAARWHTWALIRVRNIFSQNHKSTFKAATATASWFSFCIVNFLIISPSWWTTSWMHHLLL